MANYKVEELEGIGPKYGALLREAGVASTDALLKACITKRQREQLAEKTGIKGELILKFANMADLFRINGVGSEYAELLEAAGVDTVPELAMRNAENLTERMVQCNKEKKLVRREPPLTSVKDWIEQAKKLPRVLEY